MKAGGLPEAMLARDETTPLARRHCCTMGACSGILFALTRPLPGVLAGGLTYSRASTRGALLRHPLQRCGTGALHALRSCSGQRVDGRHGERPGEGGEPGERGAAGSVGRGLRLLPHAPVCLQLLEPGTLSIRALPPLSKLVK